MIDNYSDKAIIVSMNKVENDLRRHLDDLKKRDIWIAPVSILATIFSVFLTADFKQFIFSADTWAAFFLFLILLCASWLLWSLKILFRSPNIDTIIKELIHNKYAEFNSAILPQPKVFKTSPSDGEILKIPENGIEYLFTVTYDLIMSKRGWSWCTTENTDYPSGMSKNNRPRWDDDGKTCSLRMKIYPDRQYGISFNIKNKFENFKSCDGVPAKPFDLRFKTVKE